MKPLFLNRPSGAAGATQRASACRALCFWPRAGDRNAACADLEPRPGEQQSCPGRWRRSPLCVRRLRIGRRCIKFLLRAQFHTQSTELSISGSRSVAFPSTRQCSSERTDFKMSCPPENFCMRGRSFQPGIVPAPLNAEECGFRGVAIERCELKPIGFTVAVRNGDRRRIGTAASGQPWRLDSTGKLRLPVATEGADHAQVEGSSAAPFPQTEPAPDRPQLFHLAKHRP